MDYDNDGDLDVLSGSYTGEIYLFERDEDGNLAQGRFLVASDGKPLVTGTSVTPEAVDVDADGDLDLVIGTRTSGAYVVENSGTRSAPSWAPKPRRLKTAKGTRIKGSNAHHADWDGDGLLDLILGSESSGVVWHKNIGSKKVAAYAESQTLVGRSAKPSGNLKAGETPQGPGYRTKVHVTDWNGDGRVDLLVGDAQFASYQLPPLTEEQLAEKAAFQPVHDAAKEKYWKVVEERNDCVRARKPIPEELQARYKAANDAFAPFRKKMYSFTRRRSKCHGWVWLYLRGSEADAVGRAGAASSREGPVALEVTASPVKGKEGQYLLAATVTVDPGWHVYAAVPSDSPYPATTPRVELPAGASLLSDWTTTTPSVPSPDSPDTTWFEGRVVFSCKVNCGQRLTKPLAVTVAMQACDASTCMPPTTLKGSVSF